MSNHVKKLTLYPGYDRAGEACLLDEDGDNVLCVEHAAVAFGIPKDVLMNESNSEWILTIWNDDIETIPTLDYSIRCLFHSGCFVMYPIIGANEVYQSTDIFEPLELAIFSTRVRNGDWFRARLTPNVINSRDHEKKEAQPQSQE